MTVGGEEGGTIRVSIGLYTFKSIKLTLLLMFPFIFLKREYKRIDTLCRMHQIGGGHSTSMNKVILSYKGKETQRKRFDLTYTILLRIVL